MNKRAWPVGERIDQSGHKVHLYIWLYDPRVGLVISDKHLWHTELADIGGVSHVNPSRKTCRGVINLHPETKTGEVYMYAQGWWNHWDAEFIPDEVWKALESKFKGYKLQEQLNDDGIEAMVKGTVGSLKHKQAWPVGERTDQYGRKIHVYLWVDDPKEGLLVSDKYEWHGAFEDQNKVDLLRDCERGLVVLYPKTKTGDVYMYHGSGHSDAEFIPNEVWKHLQARFKGYRLEEKQGLEEEIASYWERAERAGRIKLPKPSRILAFKNALLQPAFVINKQAWPVGERTDRYGRKVHVYLWVNDDKKGLFVSDKQKWHYEVLLDNELTENYKTTRGLVVLYPKTKTGDVFMYARGTSNHGESRFIPNDVWKNLQLKFKGYKLEEQHGIANAASEGADIIPEAQPIYASTPIVASRSPIKSPTYPQVLPDAIAIANYIESHSNSEVDYWLIVENFEGCKAVLRELPITSIKEGDPDHNMPVSGRETRYKKRPMDTLPPLIVQEGVILDGNHRYRAAVANGLKSIWCYEIECGEE